MPRWPARRSREHLAPAGSMGRASSTCQLKRKTPPCPSTGHTPGANNKFWCQFSKPAQRMFKLAQGRSSDQVWDSHAHLHADDDNTDPSLSIGLLQCKSLKPLCKLRMTSAEFSRISGYVPCACPIATQIAHVLSVIVTLLYESHTCPQPSTRSFSFSSERYATYVGRLAWPTTVVPPGFILVSANCRPMPQQEHSAMLECKIVSY